MLINWSATALSHTIPLFSVRGGDIEQCGQKGSQLGELMSVGFPIPHGFVVTTSLYRAFMKKSGLQSEMNDLFSHVIVSGQERVMELSSQAQSLSVHYEVGDTIAKEIEAEAGTLGGDYFAVRSSGVLKKGKEWIPYDGSLATSLNVKPEKLVSNLKLCWLSLYAFPSLQYLLEHDIEAEDVMVGVVIQNMVDADISGMCYTMDIPGEDEEKLYLEAGWGLGEAMVSGIVAPDRCAVNRKTLKLARYTVGNQMKEVILEENRHRLVDVPLDRQRQRKLSNEQVRELARLCLHIEEYYGKPQAIEWAFNGSEFFILQSRALRTGPR